MVQSFISFLATPETRAAPRPDSLTTPGAGTTAVGPPLKTLLSEVLEGEGVDSHDKTGRQDFLQPAQAAKRPSRRPSSSRSPPRSLTPPTSTRYGVVFTSAYTSRKKKAGHRVFYRVSPLEPSDVTCTSLGPRGISVISVLIGGTVGVGGECRRLYHPPIVKR